MKNRVFCTGVFIFSNNPNVKIAVENIAYIIAGMLIAFVVYTGIGFLLSTSEPLVTVVSESMEPTLFRGDMLVLKGITFDAISTGKEDGDIVVYICPNSEPKCPDGDKLIVHRVFKKNPDGTLTTWGDNNPAYDRWNVRPEWIKGRMIIRLPYFGYPRILMSDYLNI
ncbi:MAG: signal peptidase I [Candidatus Aenigmarchaeota archaeon]|nr:signal peptidase I [Candidatus Aenigmarchaeota archaeon]